MSDTEAQEAEVKKKQAELIGAYAATKEVDASLLVASRDGGQSFMVSDDPNFAVIDPATGTATLYPNGKQENPDAKLTIRSTKEGSELDFSSIPAGNQLSQPYSRGSDSEIFTISVNEQNEFSVKINNEAAFDQAYAADVRHIFKTPNGEILSLNQDGKLVQADPDQQALFGLTGQERENTRQTLATAIEAVNIHPENTPSNSGNELAPPLASGGLKGAVLISPTQ